MAAKDPLKQPTAPRMGPGPRPVSLSKIQGPKMPHKHKDPTQHHFSYPPSVVPLEAECEILGVYVVSGALILARDPQRRHEKLGSYLAILTPQQQIHNRE